MGLEYYEKTFYGIQFNTEEIPLNDFLKLIHDYRDLLHYDFINNIICLRPGSYAVYRKRTQVNFKNHAKLIKLKKMELPKMDLCDYFRIGQLCRHLPQPLTFSWYKIINII